MIKPIKLLFLGLLWLWGLNSHTLGADDRILNQILEQARAAIGEEADLNKLSSLQLVGRLTPFGADEPSARLVVIAQKPCYHRFELRYEHVVETTLCDGQRACILRAKLPDGRPQMRWLDAAQVEAIHQSVHHLFHFYRPTQQGENVRCGTTSVTSKTAIALSIVIQMETNDQCFNCVSGRLVSVVDWNGREAEF